VNKSLTPCPSPKKASPPAPLLKARGERKEGEKGIVNSEKGKVNRDEEIFKRN
jgi:hypothetical protein